MSQMCQMYCSCRLMGGRALQSLQTFTSLRTLHIRSLRPHLTTNHLNNMLQHLNALEDLDIKAQVQIHARLARPCMHDAG